MIFIVVLAVGLGLSFRYATAGVGVPILLLGPATVLRVAPIVVHRRKEGRADKAPGMGHLVLESCLVVLVLVVSASIAFVAVCFPVGLMTFNLNVATPYLWTAFAGGGLAACVVLYLIGRRIFPPKD